MRRSRVWIPVRFPPGDDPARGVQRGALTGHVLGSDGAPQPVMGRCHADRTLWSTELGRLS